MSRVVIKSGDDCESAASRARIFDSSQVDLEVGLEPAAERRTEERLNRLQGECGCTQTAIALLVTFVPAAILIWATRPTGSSTGSAIGLTVIAFLAATILASIVKVSSIWISRQRYRHTLLALAVRLREEPPTTSDGYA